MIDWGIPNWKDAESYGDTASWGVHRWRWEFYRRRDDLRRDYWEFAEEKYLENCEFHGTSENIYKPTDKEFTVGILDFEEKYGYFVLPNPSYGDQPLKRIFPLGDREDDMTLVLSGNEKTSSREINVKPSTFGFVFNLEKAIAPQIEAARQTLESLQAETLGKKLPRRRRHTGKYLTYLRVLDARESKASWSEIAEILTFTAGTPQTAAEVHGQALALCFNSWT